jgi:hypothetical protein
MFLLKTDCICQSENIQKNKERTNIFPKESKKSKREQKRTRKYGVKDNHLDTKASAARAMNCKSCIKGFVTFLCHEHVTVTTVHDNDGSSLFRACRRLAAYQTPVLGGVPVQNQLLMLRHQVEIQQQRSE